MQLPAWFSISLWILLGYSMILFNKILLTSWGFKYPFLLTTWHCLLATILTQILSRTTNWFPAVRENKINLNDYMKKIVPLAMLFAYGLVAGNLAYQYISLSYIQMVKAVTPVPLLLLTFATGREKPSVAQLFIVLVVSFGVLLSSVGELRFSLIGFLLQSSAVCTDCFRMLLLDIVLKDSKVDSLSMLYYTAPISAILIAAGFVHFELPTFDFEILTTTLRWALLANGMLAFFLNLAVFFLVSNCSAVIMSVSGPIKDILVVITSVIMFKAPVTLLQVVGFSISLFGLNLFRQFKANPAAMHQFGREVRSNIWDAIMFTVRSMTSTTTDINKVMGISDREQAQLLELEIGSSSDVAAEQEALLEV